MRARPSLALSFVVLAALGPARAAHADPDALQPDALGTEPDAQHPITVTARLYRATDAVIGGDLLADRDPDHPRIVNGADLGVAPLLVVVGLGVDLGGRSATLTVTNRKHGVRRRWKARPYLHELFVVDVDTCEPITLTVAVGHQRLTRSIATGCFE